MPLLPTTLLTLGSIFLIHACYSAYEHSSLLALTPTTPSPTALSTTTTTTTLPPDITLETLLSVLLLCAGIVFASSNEGLKPISWRVWAAGVDHGGSDKVDTANGKEGGGIGRDTTGSGEGAIYKLLEQGRRRGFIDLRAQRKEFAEWVRKGE